jgi:hypothetical protein
MKYRIKDSRLENKLWVESFKYCFFRSSYGNASEYCQYFMKNYDSISLKTKRSIKAQLSQELKRQDSVLVDKHKRTVWQNLYSWMEHR